MNTKPVHVVMLPTKRSKISISLHTQQFFPVASSTKWYTDVMDNTIPQHLYFISTDPNEEIKEGDWYIHNNCLYKAKKIGDDSDPTYDNLKYINARRAVTFGYYKVICSSDPAIGLPAIPLTWIRDVYVPSGGAIKTVRLLLE